MSKKHLVFIINPKSGVDRVKEISYAIAEHLDHEKFSHELVYTQYAKHGIDLARGAATAGAYAVVAVGGDGSVNDIVNGLQGTNVLLGILPKGSGNGMARTLQIPLDLVDAIKVINKEHVINMDVAYANDRLFISNAGVAFDALISKKFAKSTRRGLLMYSWLVTKYMWLYKEWKWDIILDGKPLAERAFIISVANGRQFGYNFKIAPHADYTDGWLDVIVIRRFPKILGGALVLRALNGSIIKSPFVKHYKAKEIIISHPSLNLMQTDGDSHPCENSVTFVIKPAGQKILVP